MDLSKFDVNEDAMLAVFQKADEAFRTQEADFKQVRIIPESMDEVKALNLAIAESWIIQHPNGLFVTFTPDGRELFSNLRKAKEERQRKQEEMELQRLALAEVQESNRIALEANKTSGEAVAEAKRANEIAVGANTRASCSMAVAIVAAVISSGSIISVLSFWFFGK